jgi:hypothetical protein
MMYHEKFAAAIKINGQVLRESGDIVTLPFGSEYSIYMKNLNTVKAMVRVYIDSHDVTEGWVIIEPNSTIDLERSIRGHNLNEGNRFKFIERTAQIENFRGVGLEDGLIRVEYKFAIPQYQPHYWPNNGFLRGRNFSKGKGISGSGSFNAGPSSRSVAPSFYASSSSSWGDSDSTNSCYTSSLNSQVSTEPSGQAMNCNFLQTQPVALNDAGITVEGSISGQQFYDAAWFPTEASSHSIIFRLKGRVGNQKIAKAVTVKEAKMCSICGRSNKHKNRFCAGCGASLQIVGAETAVR